MISVGGQYHHFIQRNVLLYTLQHTRGNSESDRITPGFFVVGAENGDPYPSRCVSGVIPRVNYSDSFVFLFLF